MLHTRKWWNERRAQVAAAVDAAEESTGHQVLVWAGKLAGDASKVADAVAARFPSASIVFCVDPRYRLFEIRWSSGSELHAAEVSAVAREHLAAGDLAAAVTAVAALLPPPAAGADAVELPDIVDE